MNFFTTEHGMQLSSSAQSPWRRRPISETFSSMLLKQPPMQMPFISIVVHCVALFETSAFGAHTFVSVQLTTGTRMLVCETPDEVAAAVREWRTSVLAGAVRTLPRRHSGLALVRAAAGEQPFLGDNR